VTTLPATHGTAGGASAVQVLAGQVSGGRAAIQLEAQAVQGRLSLLAETLPPGGAQAIQSALSRTTDRVLSAYDDGRLTAEEARQSIHLVAEMLDAMAAIQRGQVTVTRVPAGGDDKSVALEVKTTDNDVMRVMVRATGDERGQARLKLLNVQDNGAAIPSTQRLMVRVDLEGSENGGTQLKAAVDVTFGEGKPPPGQEPLDTRIHGIMLDQDGQPLLNRGGRTIADHHFSEGVPDTLHDREGFAAFTQAFLDKLLPLAKEAP
jgi:hypothetical protein